MKNELVQIKLVKRPTFTGVFGRYNFTDGTSELMPRHDAERLSAITTVEFIGTQNLWERKAQERGELTGKDRAAKMLNKAAEKRAAEAQKATKGRPGRPPKAVAEEAPSGPSGETGQTRIYTRVELEDIADSKGIKGLREIAEPLKVSANTIRATIDGIIRSQGLG